MSHKVLVVPHKINGMFKEYSDYAELENKISDRLKEYPNYHVVEIKYKDDNNWIIALLNLKLVELKHDI